MWKRNDIVETVNHASKEASTVSVLKRGAPTWRPQSSAGHLVSALCSLAIGCETFTASDFFMAMLDLCCCARAFSSCGSSARAQ